MMNTTLRQFALGGFTTGAMLLGGNARATFRSVTCERFTGEGWVENGYAGLATYRVYGEFDECCEDGVLSVYGSPGLPMMMWSSNGEFHNAPGSLDSLTAPEDLRGEGIWENQWDTYVTINATDASGDATTTAPPGFATDTNNLATNWSTTNGGWFVTPLDEQSRHEDGRVLIGQFTVEFGAGLSGEVNLLLVDGTGGPSRLAFRCAAPCHGDADGSGDIGLGDILAILSAWGNEGGPEDVDDSGFVDMGDLLFVLVAWGPCLR